MSDITWQNITVKLGELKPWSSNPRMSTKAQARRLLESWNDFGQVETIAVSPSFQVYDGHQRLSALLTVYGRDYEVDARQSSRELSDEERRKLVVFLHSGAVGDWNWDELANWSTPELIGWGLDADLLKSWNNDANALKEMLTAEKLDLVDAEAQIDRAAELNEKWQVKTGDLFKIGSHFLLCGDSTVKADVERVMGGEKASLLFTSPPYMDARDYGGDDLELSKITKFIPDFADVSELLAVNLGMVRKDNEMVRYWDEYIAEAELAGLKLLSWNVWDRGQPWSMAQNTAMFPVEHEWILVFGEKRKKLNLTVENKTPGTRTGITNRQKDGTLSRAEPKEVRPFRPLGTIFRSPPQIGADIGHPAMFPVALPNAYIEACTSPFDVVAEPFCGSGTTMVACENLHRKCRAIEISPNYCAVILERMSTAFPELEIQKVQ